MAKPTRKRITTTVRLPKNLLRRVKHWCVDHDVTLQAAIEQALHDLIGGKR